MDMFVEESKTTRPQGEERRSSPLVNKPTTMSHNKNGTVDGQKSGQTVYIVGGGMFAHEQQQRKYLVMTNYPRYSPVL